MFCLSMFIRKRHTLTGCSRRYHLDESTFIFKGLLGASGVIFHFISFSGKNHMSKQNSRISDAAKRGVTSGAIMFAYVP